MRLPVEAFARLLCTQQCLQRLRADEAADMRGKDAV